MRVAIAGTNGLACWIAYHMQSTFHSCIMLTRNVCLICSTNPVTSTDISQPHHRLSTSYPMMIVSYTDETGLIYTLSGVDLVISFVSGNDQLLLIDASLKAGVARFVPAEFGISPETRGQYSALDRGQKLAQIRLRDHVAEGMEYTIILCGVLYERLGPGGLANFNLGHVQGPNGEGDFLLDMRSMAAQIPHNRTGGPAMLCLSSAQDVARAIVAALDVPNWPHVFRFQGERMNALGERSSIQ